MGTHQPGRKPTKLKVDLVAATPEQLAACLVDVDPVKAGRVAYLVGQRLAEDGGPVGRTFAAADADPMGFLASMFGAALQHGRVPYDRAAKSIAEWTYEEPNGDG